MTAEQVSLRNVGKTFMSGRPPAPLHALGPIDLELRAASSSRSSARRAAASRHCSRSSPDSHPRAKGPSQFEGRPIAGEAPDGIGVVFQEDASLPWLNVRENVAFGLRRSSAAPSRRRPSACATRCNSSACPISRPAYPAQLSGGMRQRVCIARTLVMQPSLILLDEPFGALDQQTRLLMGDELLRLWRQTGATVFLITHALDEATMLADRIAVMSARPGRLIDIVETGWPRERDSRIIEHADFGRHHRPAVEELREESLKTIGRPSALPPPTHESRHLVPVARGRRGDRDARSALPHRCHRQDHDAGAAPDRARPVPHAGLGADERRDRQDADQHRAGTRLLARGRHRLRRAPASSPCAARYARSAVRHLLRRADLRVLSVLSRGVRVGRRTADPDRVHARRGRGDREHAQRPGPRAARTAEDRAHPCDVTAWTPRCA